MQDKRLLNSEKKHVNIYRRWKSVWKFNTRFSQKHEALPVDEHTKSFAVW